MYGGRVFRDRGEDPGEGREQALPEGLPGAVRRDRGGPCQSPAGCRKRPESECDSAPVAGVSPAHPPADRRSGPHHRGPRRPTGRSLRAGVLLPPGPRCPMRRPDRHLGRPARPLTTAGQQPRKQAAFPARWTPPRQWENAGIGPKTTIPGLHARISTPRIGHTAGALEW